MSNETNGLTTRSGQNGNDKTIFNVDETFHAMTARVWWNVTNHPTPHTRKKLTIIYLTPVWWWGCARHACVRWEVTAKQRTSFLAILFYFKEIVFFDDRTNNCTTTGGWFISSDYSSSSFSLLWHGQVIVLQKTETTDQATERKMTPKQQQQQPKNKK